MKQFGGDSPEVYLKAMRGRAHFQTFSRAGHVEAERIFRELLKEHPQLAFEGLVGWIHWQKVVLGVSADPLEDLKAARRLGKIAAERHPDHGWIYTLLGTVALQLGEYDAAVEYADLGLQLAPGAAETADGISEDLITALSKIRWFFVIARNSSFTYKGPRAELQIKQ